MAVGSVHLIETLEFLRALRKIGWDEPILLDQFPFREDPVEAAAREHPRRSGRSTRALDRLDPRRSPRRRSARTRSPPSGS